jgi:hypothetical protein
MDARIKSGHDEWGKRSGIPMSRALRVFHFTAKGVELAARRRALLSIKTVPSSLWEGARLFTQKPASKA